MKNMSHGLLSVLMLWLALLGSSAQAQTTAAFTRTEISDTVTSALASAADKHHLGIDPQIYVDVIADATLFVSNFCGEYATKDQDPCATTFSDPAVLRTVLGEFLAEAATLVSQLETVSSRLARRAGRTMAEAGWSSIRENNIGIVLVPATLRKTRLSIRTAAGDIEIGKGIEKILLVDGMHVITASFVDGQNKSIRVWAGAQHLGRLEAADTPQEKIVGRIEASLKNFCEADASVPRNAATSIFNGGRATFQESVEERRAHLVPAASQAALDIRVVDKGQTCNGACLAGLGHAFAEALAIWRSGCDRCESSALSVIRVGNNVWLDRRAASRLRKAIAQAAVRIEFDLAKTLPGETVALSTPSLSVPLSHIVGYEQINQDKDFVDALCRLPASPSAGWLAGTRGFLCAGAPSPNLRLRPSLVIMQGNTDCGAEAIACAVSGGEVQLNTNAYRYALATPAGQIHFGNPAATGEYDARPIVLHEVGHWFGIPHPEQVTSRSPTL